MKPELEFDNVSLLAVAGVTVLIAAIIGVGVHQIPSDDIRDYRIETPLPLDVLGTSIEDFRENMSEARLVSSTDKYTDRFKRVEKEFTWNFLPNKERPEEFMNWASNIGLDIENTRSERAFKKVSFTARIDRTGRIVSVRLKQTFEDIDTFRNYYKLRLSHMIDRIDKTDRIICFNSEPSPFGSDNVEKFELGQKKISEWKYVKKCEQAGWEVTNMKGQGETTSSRLSLDTANSPEERTKENKEDRYIVESAYFKSYM